VRIDASNLQAMAIGCSILGAGGGGDTAVGVLASLQAVQDFGPVDVVDLDDLDDDDLVMPCGGIGAPMVWIEKIDRGDEIERIIPVVERLWDRTSWPDVGRDQGRTASRRSRGARGPGCRCSAPWHGPCQPGVHRSRWGRRDLAEPRSDDHGAATWRSSGGDGHWMERMERAAAVGSAVRRTPPNTR
jgi:hypothetical protein